MSLAIRSVPLKSLLLIGAVAVFTHPAAAQQDVMKVCGAEWQKVKDKNKGAAPKGVTWKSYLSDCRKRLAKSEAKTAPKKATTTKKPDTKTAAKPQDVMKICGAEWQKVKDKNKGAAPKGVTWKSYLSDCRKRVAKTDTKPATKKAAPKKASTTPKKSAPTTTKAAAKPQDVMKVCGAEWQAVKAKNKGEAPKGVTWKSFLSDCRKRTAGSTTAAKTTKSAAKPKKTAAKSKASGESMMATCGAEWQKIKDKNKGEAPKGMSWSKYLGECSERYAGKFKPTPGQLAMYSRARKCGAEWRAAKEKGSLKKGAKWPQYWSACNKRMKAKGL